MKHYEYFVDIKQDFKDTQSTLVLPKDKIVGTELIEYPCHIFVDQASKTGYTIIDNCRRLVKLGLIEREKESVEEFKYALKEVLIREFEEYKIKDVWYEDVFNNGTDTSTLEYFKSLFKDLSFELQDKIRVLALSNQRWKQLLASPLKFTYAKKGDPKKLEKKEVQKHVAVLFPLLKLPEDTMDSLGMAIAVGWKQNKKLNFYNARINKTLPIHHEVLILKNGETIEERISKMTPKYVNKLENSLIYEFDYVEKYDEILNCRYILTYRDCVVYCEIPQHRDYGLILLHYGIVPKTIAEGDKVVIVAIRKT